MLPTDDVIRKTLRPPTHAGEVYCKQVRLDQLGKEERDLFIELFPRFFEEPKEHPMLCDLQLMGLRTEEVYNERRFGVPSLPRGCYYTECSPETGFSQQTLAMELVAYARAPRESLVDAIDMADPASGALAGSFESDVTSRCRQYQNRCIIAVLHPLRSGHGKGRRQTLVIPYNVTCLKRKAILDTRDKQAMEWLVEVLWEYFPGALFMDLGLTEGQEGRTAYSVLPPMRYEGALHKLEKSLEDPKAARFGFKNCGLGQLLGERARLFSILQCILNPALGGTPLDTIVGEILVASGVDCLVYPSARHDCGVYYEGDARIGFLGWNVVDFSGIGSPSRRLAAYMIDSAPTYLSLQGHCEFTFSTVQSSPYEVNSWHLHGSAMVTRDEMVRRAWRAQLEIECSDFQLEPAVVIERTPWQSYSAGKKYRKPREFETWLDLRLAIITKEVSLGSFLLDNRRRRTSTRLGDLIVTLSRDHDLWGNGVTATDFDEDDSFLVCRKVGLICPACGDLAEQLSLERVQRCLICGFSE